MGKGWRHGPCRKMFLVQQKADDTGTEKGNEKMSPQIILSCALNLFSVSNRDLSRNQSYAPVIGQES